jgi:RNase H-fold protein (predicted Holliday junction resolvase)
MAESALRESGMRRRQRRENVDKVAAALFLQDYLDQLG